VRREEDAMSAHARRFVLFLLMLATIAAAAASLTPRAGAQSIPRSLVLYDGAYYSQSYGQMMATSDLPDLGTYSWTHKVSSIRLAGGLSVASIFLGANYRGGCMTVRGDIPWMGMTPFGNDNVASLKLNTPCGTNNFDAPGVMLFRNTNFSGDERYTSYDVPDLEQLGFTGEANSIHPWNGATIAIYTQTHFQGICDTVPSDRADLGPLFDGKVASLKVNASCTGPVPPNTAGVELFDTPHYTSGNKAYLIGDTPDLRTLKFNDSAVSAKFNGAWAVSVYTDINYQGTCETLVHNADDLTLHTVGAHTISSVRVNRTCDGATLTSAPVAVDLTIADGNSAAIKCPSGYTQSPQDLNAFAGGDYIYACTKYAADTPDTQRLTWLGVYDYSPGTQWTRRGDCGQYGGQLVDMDLNRGAGGDFIYFCYLTKSGRDANGSSFRALEFPVIDHGFNSAATAKGICHQDIFPERSEDDLTMSDNDLNAGTRNGHPIYACALEY
jgi:hypothetical protein